MVLANTVMPDNKLIGSRPSASSASRPTWVPLGGDLGLRASRPSRRSVVAQIGESRKGGRTFGARERPHRPGPLRGGLGGLGRGRDPERQRREDDGARAAARPSCSTPRGTSRRPGRECDGVAPAGLAAVLQDLRDARRDVHRTPRRRSSRPTRRTAASVSRKPPMSAAGEIDPYVGLGPLYRGATLDRGAPSDRTLCPLALDALYGPVGVHPWPRALRPIIRASKPRSGPSTVSSATRASERFRTHSTARCGRRRTSVSASHCRRQACGRCCVRGGRLGQRRIDFVQAPVARRPFVEPGSFPRHSRRRVSVAMHADRRRPRPQRRRRPCPSGSRSSTPAPT